jgi:alpha-tubulin suppressor-like RCC1 family protein
VDVSGLTSGVSAIATGWDHTCALMTSGGIKCWGGNSFGQLGDGTTTQRTTPVDVSGLTSGVSAIATGALHTCALTSSGGVKCWGFNGYGQIGSAGGNRTAPVDVSGLASGVRAIDAGAEHTCALMASGSVKCWGYNCYGQLGDGTTWVGNTCLRMTPVDVIGLTSGVSAITAGTEHTCALMASDGVKCWGNNWFGQLGDGTGGSLNNFRTAPVDVSGLASGVSAIAAGHRHTCALMTSGGVKCWGRNYYGELGDGTTTDRYTPATVSGLTSGASAIATGGDITEETEYYLGGYSIGHTCALMADNGLKCWGYNHWGQLGDGTTTNRYTPVDVVGLGGATAMPINRSNVQR